MHGLLIGYLGIDGWGTSLTAKVDQETELPLTMVANVTVRIAEPWKHGAFSV